MQIQSLCRITCCDISFFIYLFIYLYSDTISLIREEEHEEENKILQ